MSLIRQWSLVLILPLSFCVAYAIYLFQNRGKMTGYTKGKSRNSNFRIPFGIREIYQLARSARDGTVLSYMDRLWDQYGDTFVISIFGARVVFTRDAAAIRQILSVQWVDYDTAKGIRTEMFKLLAPGSIASTDGKAWEDERRKWRRSLAHNDQLLDLPFLEKSFRLFLGRIPAGDAVDLQPLVLDMVTDIIRNFVIGESAHRLDPENQPEETRESVAALERIGPAMVVQGLLGPLSWLIPRNNFKADCRLFKGLLKRTIRGKLASRESSQAVSDSSKAYKTSFLDRLSIHTSDPEILSNDVTAALMASESTARPISHTIWLLSQHPEIYAKLRKSIADTVGNREPTYEELNKFIYLRNVINESLRLLPPTSVTLRRANRDTWLPSGGGEDGTEQLLLHKGDRVFISIFGTQRLPANFGKDACEFKPERWEHLSVNTPGFAVFSMGPRLCAGRAFVYHILTYLLVRFIQTNPLIENRNEASLEPQVSISMSNGNGVWVTLRPDIPRP